MEFFDMRVRSSVRRINDVRPSVPQVTNDYIKCDYCATQIEIPLSQMNKIKELIIQCELKSKECYEAWMSLTTTNEHLEAVQMELDKMTFKSLTISTFKRFINPSIYIEIREPCYFIYCT